MGQCSDGFLINTKLLDVIDIFYEKYVKKNKNMFLDDDLWFAIYLQKIKKSKIENLIEKYSKKFSELVKKITETNMFRSFPDINDIPN